MIIIKNLVIVTSVIVFIICVYSFLLGNGVFKGKFENESIAWYILAKGIFCSLMLYLAVCVLEALGAGKNK